MLKVKCNYLCWKCSDKTYVL